MVTEFRNLPHYSKFPSNKPLSIASNMSKKGSEETSSREADNLDPNLFTELISTCNFLGKDHIWTPSTTPGIPRYFLKLRAGFRKGKPELELHLGKDGTGPIVGCAKLHLNANEMCIGDHTRVIEEGDDVADRSFWESLVKQSERFKYGLYEFEYGNGSGGVGSMGQRMRYTWRRTVCGWGNNMREWELRTGARDSEGGELLAVWKREGWKGFKKGRLFVKTRFEDMEREKDKWEVAVILSLMIIIETHVRRE
jgi:hypothetical protein